ncbi:hypothetical protein LTR56_010887 [Elasticomyces elasticus]|nr:hypothetical protein LTR56_010887 [Elasticomyces elasticus]KAK3650240.1 hypothetical protein LTR22_012567 [Elasticomyces elasticus]KAK4911831.1 hypothetical protein LTR49_019631 [Elasticomyces elasticus]KAK5768259.1 hypothetical protein LTS12_001398 [Elasticomyces elasticus]
MPVTEIATCPLKAGANIGDPNDQTAAVLSSLCDDLRATDGMQQLHFGTRMEDPTMLELVLDWDTVKHHQTFMASDIYGPFMNRLNSICEGNVSGMHIDFVPAGGLSKTLSAPATEIATFYFDGEPESDYTDNVAKLDKALQGIDGYLGYTIGITHETLEKEDVKGKAAVLTIGWQSREAHMAFRETQAYKDNIHLLRSNSKKITMWHVQFMQSL